MYVKNRIYKFFKKNLECFFLYIIVIYRFIVLLFILLEIYILCYLLVLNVRICMLMEWISGLICINIINLF